MKDWAEITKMRRLDMLERVVFPAICKLPVSEITPHHILRILQETAKRGAPTVAAEARRTISSVFELEVATLKADSDPVWPVRKALPANKTQHQQALNPQQIGKLLSCFTIVVTRTRLTIACGLCGGHWRVLQKSPKQNGQNSILIMHCGPFRQRE